MGTTLSPDHNCHVRGKMAPSGKSYLPAYNPSSTYPNYNHTSALKQTRSQLYTKITGTNYIFKIKNCSLLKKKSTKKSKHQHLHILLFSFICISPVLRQCVHTILNYLFTDMRASQIVSLWKLFNV